MSISQICSNVFLSKGSHRIYSRTKEHGYFDANGFEETNKKHGCLNKKHGYFVLKSKSLLEPVRASPPMGCYSFFPRIYHNAAYIG